MELRAPRVRDLNPEMRDWWNRGLNLRPSKTPISIPTPRLAAAVARRDQPCMIQEAERVAHYRGFRPTLEAYGYGSFRS